MKGSEVAYDLEFWRYHIRVFWKMVKDTEYGIYPKRTTLVQKSKKSKHFWTIFLGYETFILDFSCSRFTIEPKQDSMKPVSSSVF